MSMTPPPSAPGGAGGPAGWYPAPGNPAVEHWWDGTAWTGHTRFASPATVVAAPPPARRSGRPIAVAAAVVAAVAVAATAVVALDSGDEPPAATGHTS
ncbi:DUF2510 domain-containing protein, partial [Streptomyces sp. WAC05374]